MTTPVNCGRSGILPLLFICIACECEQHWKYIPLWWLHWSLLDMSPACGIPRTLEMRNESKWSICWMEICLLGWLSLTVVDASLDFPWVLIDGNQEKKKLKLTIMQSKQQPVNAPPIFIETMDPTNSTATQVHFCFFVKCFDFLQSFSVVVFAVVDVSVAASNRKWNKDKWKINFVSDRSSSRRREWTKWRER